MKKTSFIIALLMALNLPAAAREVVKPVKLMTIETSEIGATRQFFGQVVARQTVDLAFQVGGQIVEFPVIEGSLLQEGELIAKLDTELYELALDQAKLQKEQADRDVERLGRLTGTTVSQVALDDAVTAAGLADLSVRNAEYNLKHATLIAPFDAMVAARDVANFTTINAGTPVARLHDMSELRIEIDVPEILFQRAGRDPDVRLTASFPTSDKVFDLEVREFNAEATNVGQTFRLTFGMPQPENLQILPGSSVTVSATFLGGHNRIILPASALRIGQDGAVSVMVFEGNGTDQGTLREAAIKVSPNENGQFVVSSGLSGGEEIVRTGVAGLRDGQTVRRFAGFAN